MPLYIAQSGDLDRCCHNAFRTRSLPTLKNRATQLLTKYKSGALVTQLMLSRRSLQLEPWVVERWRTIRRGHGHPPVQDFVGTRKARTFQGGARAVVLWILREHCIRRSNIQLWWRTCPRHPDCPGPHNWRRKSIVCPALSPGTIWTVRPHYHHHYHCHHRQTWAGGAGGSEDVSLATMIVTKREAKARWVFEAILLVFRRPRVEVNFVEIPQAALEKEAVEG